jgi:hypothetical protein
MALTKLCDHKYPPFWAVEESFLTINTIINRRYHCFRTYNPDILNLTLVSIDNWFYIQHLHRPFLYPIGWWTQSWTYPRGEFSTLPLTKKPRWVNRINTQFRRSLLAPSHFRGREAQRFQDCNEILGEKASFYLWFYAIFREKGVPFMQSDHTSYRFFLPGLNNYLLAPYRRLMGVHWAQPRRRSEYDHWETGCTKNICWH